MEGALMKGRSLEIIPMEIGDHTISPTPEKYETERITSGVLVYSYPTL